MSMLERPTAPGGATGGGERFPSSFRFISSPHSLLLLLFSSFVVEYEAVNYLVRFFLFTPLPLRRVHAFLFFVVSLTRFLLLVMM